MRDFGAAFDEDAPAVCADDGRRRCWQLRFAVHSVEKFHQERALRWRRARDSDARHAFERAEALFEKEERSLAGEAHVDARQTALHRDGIPHGSL